MTDTGATAALSALRPMEAGGLVVATHFLDDTAAFVLGEEALLLVARNGETRRCPVHAGAILSSASDRERVVTGGDDGNVIAIDAGGQSITVASDPKRRWIDRVA